MNLAILAFLLAAGPSAAAAPGGAAIHTAFSLTRAGRVVYVDSPEP
jgi:hypothetical protein